MQEVATKNRVFVKNFILKTNQFAMGSNKMARVLMVTHSPAPDYRIDREAEALVAAGHELYLIYPKQKREVSKIYKQTFLIPLNLRQRALGPIASRIAARKFKKIIDKIKPQIIHAHDITAANIVRFVLPKEAIYIYDDHEIWEFLRKRQAEVTKNFVKKVIVKGIRILTKRINKKITEKANLIIVINDHWISYYEKRGIAPSKIITLENFASKNLLDEVKKAKAKCEDFFLKDKRKKIIHSSKLKLSARVVRDVTNITKAAFELEDWVMVVFGEPDEEFSKLGVKFIAQKPRMEYLTSCLQCDIALNPLFLDERFNYSSSNRLYEFISLGLRVIATPAQTYLDKFGESLIWIKEDTSVEDIKRILEKIETYPTGKELRKFLDTYNWEDAVKVLVNRYEELLNS